MRATQASSTFERTWVKTIVWSSPTRSASRAAARKDKAERSWVPKKSRPRASGPVPNRRKNQ